MATFSGHRIVSATLTATTVDTITLDVDYTRVEIVNRTGDAEIWVTIDGTDPTVTGNDCDVLPTAIGSLILDAPAIGKPTAVKLISSGTPSYTVKGLQG